jgi:hypothetical protein
MTDTSVEGTIKGLSDIRDNRTSSNMTAIGNAIYYLNEYKGMEKVTMSDLDKIVHSVGTRSEGVYIGSLKQLLISKGLLDDHKYVTVRRYKYLVPMKVGGDKYFEHPKYYTNSEAMVEFQNFNVYCMSDKYRDDKEEVK